MVEKGLKPTSFIKKQDQSIVMASHFSALPVYQSFLSCSVVLFCCSAPFPHLYLLLLLLLTSSLTPDQQLTSQPDHTVVAMVTRLLLKGTEENGAFCCSASTLGEKDVVPETIS